MIKIIHNQRGVTLIETVVSTAIIAIILVIILGTLLFGQKMLIFNDVKNNAASIGQNQIDGMMASISSGNVPTTGSIMVEGFKVDSEIIEVDKNGDGIKEGYGIKVRTYYNNDESYVELKAYAKKDGVKV